MEVDIINELPWNSNGEQKASGKSNLNEDSMNNCVSHKKPDKDLTSVDEEEPFYGFATCEVTESQKFEKYVSNFSEKEQSLLGKKIALPVLKVNLTRIDYKRSNDKPHSQEIIKTDPKEDSVVPVGMKKFDDPVLNESSQKSLNNDSKLLPNMKTENSCSEKKTKKLLLYIL
ncbi:hypothetical protein TKK_0011547 [Trichogramma kaykai]